MISYERISFPGRQESPKSKDFPRRAGLYAEVASQFTPSIKGCEAAWLDMRKFVCLPSDEKIKEEKDFLIREGEFSECLAAEHRISGCELT